MNSQTRLSSKGQVVIPKAIRDALCLKPGEILSVSRQGRRILLEATDTRPRLSYEEFKRRVPPYTGPRVTIEEMDDLSAIFEGWTI